MNCTAEPSGEMCAHLLSCAGVQRVHEPKAIPEFFRSAMEFEVFRQLGLLAIAAEADQICGEVFRLANLHPISGKWSASEAANLARRNDMA